MENGRRDEASLAVEAVRARVLFLAKATQHAVAELLGLDPTSARPPALTRETLERFARQWRFLLPEEEELRQRVLVQLDSLGDETPDDGDDPLLAAVREFEWVSLAKGRPVVSQGEPTDCMYLVVSGRLRVVATNPAGEAVHVGGVSRGQTVGEMGLVTGETRSASVYADRDSALLRLSKEGWERLIDRYPRLILGITRLLVLRLRERHVGARQAPLATLAIVPLGADAPAGPFARRLTAALARHGRTLLLERASVDDEMALLAWLNDREMDHDYLVFQADPEPTEWTLRCLRQADRILLLVPPSGDPALRPLEQDPWVDAAAGETPRDLVLLRRAGTVPSGTAAWLARRTVAAHHHVVVDDEADHRRLARQLVGRAVGLVLGGGGNRGLTHAGVIRAIVEAGVPIDWVAGTSSGAIVAAQYASGWDVATLIERNRAWAMQARRMFDFTLPLISLIASSRLNRALVDMYGDRRIEDLPIGFFCVSANLTRGEPKIHRDGPVWEAVRASSSIPGLMPPVRHAEGLLVDGMLFDNLPIDVMSGFCNGGPVIGVDVSSRSDLRGPYNFGASVSTLEILLGRLNPFARERLRAPSARASLYLIPPVTHLGLFEMQAIDEMIETGYTFARERIARWLEERGDELAYLRDAGARPPTPP
jgi:NTE family protein